MAERSRRGGGRRSGASELEGRDLLVGRSEQAADPGEAARSGRGSSATAGAEADAAQDATLAQILDRLRVMKARLDVLQAAPEASDEATVALKRAQAQLDQAVQEARGQLAAAAVPDAKRAQEVATAAKLLVDGAAALKEQAGAVERRLEASREHETNVKQVVDALEERSGRLDSGVGALERELERRTASRRRRAALAGGVLVATAAVAFVGGAVVQRETGFATLGDPRHAWNAHVVARYAPHLAACASKARVDDMVVRCVVRFEPGLAVTAPVYPGRQLKRVASGEEDDEYLPATVE